MSALRFTGQSDLESSLATMEHQSLEEWRALSSQEQADAWIRYDSLHKALGIVLA